MNGFHIILKMSSQAKYAKRMYMNIGVLPLPRLCYNKSVIKIQKYINTYMLSNCFIKTALAVIFELVLNFVQFDFAE